MKQSELGLGDFFQAIEHLDPTNQELITRIAGALRIEFTYKQADLGEARDLQTGLPRSGFTPYDEMPDRPLDHIPTDEVPEDEGSEELLPSDLEEVEAGGSHASVPRWLDEPDVKLISLRRNQPYNTRPLIQIFDPQYERHTVIRLASRRSYEGDIDIERLVDLLVLGRPLEQIPRRPISTPRSGVQILISSSDFVSYFEQDIDHLRETLVKTIGSEKLELLWFDDHPDDGVSSLYEQAEIPYQYPSQGTKIVVVANPFEISRRNRQSVRWEAFFAGANRAKCEVVILTLSSQHLTPLTERSAEVIEWHHDPLGKRENLQRAYSKKQGRFSSPAEIAEAKIRRFVSRYPLAAELARIAALSPEITPGLLRTLRIKFLPYADTSIEALVWTSDINRVRSGQRIMYYPKIAAAFKESLQQDDRFVSIYETIQAHHKTAGAPAYIVIENRLQFLELSDVPDAGTQIENLLRRILKTIVQGEDIDGNLSRWVLRLLPTLSDETQSRETAKHLRFAAKVRFALPISRPQGAEFSREGHEWLLPANFPKRDIGVWLTEEHIVISNEPLEGAHILSVNDTHPLFVKVETADGESSVIALSQKEPMHKTLTHGRATTLHFMDGKRFVLHYDASTKYSFNYTFEFSFNYTLNEKVGQSGDRDIYKAVHNDRDKLVAIELLPLSASSSEERIRFFKQEVEILLRLDHPNIVAFYEANRRDDQAYYLAREFADDIVLNQKLRKLADEGKLMPVDEVRRILEEIGSALQFMHNTGIIHGHIVPDNILFREDGSAVLAGFEFSTFVNGRGESISLRVPGTLIGTPPYMSPEVVLGSVSDVRADIYSLGVVLFQLTTGQLPFEGVSITSLLFKITTESPPKPSLLNPSIPYDLEEIILKSLEKDPNDRFQTIEAFLTAVGISSFEVRPVDKGDAKIEPTLERVQSVKMNPLFSVPFQAPPRPINFIGRQHEIDQIRRLLLTGGTSPIGLVGLAGVGKSALATTIAYMVLDEFPDGVLWVSFTSTSVEDALDHIAAAYGHRDIVGQLLDLLSKSEFIRELLYQKKVLVILDGVTSDDQLRHLMPPYGSHVKTLITTRDSRLLSRAGAEIIPIKSFAQAEGIAYFERVLGEDRVQRELASAKAIIDLVGGLPLAMSIIAAESEILLLREYVELFEGEQVRLLTLGGDDISLSVYASIELSYEMLNPRQHQVFCALSVFDGPDFDSLAVSAVSEVSLPFTKMALNGLSLMSLLDAGLGKRDAIFSINIDGSGRYRLHPLLKLFARDKLGADREQLMERMANYYISFAVKHQEPDDYERLDFEWGHILVAIDWAYHNQQSELVLDAVLALTRYDLGTLGYADHRDYYEDARRIIGLALEMSDPETQLFTRIQLLIRAGGFAIRQSDIKGAEASLQQAETLLEHEPPSDETGVQFVYLCNFKAQLFRTRDMEQAQFWLDEGLARMEGLTGVAKELRGVLLSALSSVLGPMGSLDRAQQVAEESLTLLPQTPNSARLSALMNLSVIASVLGNDLQAESYLNEGLEMADQLGDAGRSATLRRNLSVLLMGRGDYHQALDSLLENQKIQLFLGDVENQSFEVNMRGLILMRQGEYEQAEQALQQAVEISEVGELFELELESRLNLAELYRQQQQPEAVAVQLTRAEELDALVHDRSFSRATLWQFKAQYALQPRDTSAAQEAIERSFAFSENAHVSFQDGAGWRIQGDIYSRRDDFVRAQEAYEKSLEILTKNGESYELAQSKLALATCLLEADMEQPRARQLVDEVIQIAEKMGAKPLLARADKLHQQYGE